jgi:hypothetical protein
MIYIHSIYHIWRERQSISNCSWMMGGDGGSRTGGHPVSGMSSGSPLDSAIRGFPWCAVFGGAIFGGALVCGFLRAIPAAVLHA